MAFPLLIPTLIAGLKILLIKLVGAVLVYFLYKVFMMFGSTLTEWALSHISTNVDLSDATIQFTGMAAWLADTLMLGETISLLISFCLVRFMIGMVKG